MAVEGTQPAKLSEEAAGDLSAAQFLFVKKDSNGKVVVATGATDAVIGVLQNKPKAAGQMAEIVVIGKTKLVAAGTINPNAALGTDSAGKAQSVTVIDGSSATYVQATKRSVGYLDQPAASSANDVISGFVNCTNLVPGT